MRAFPLLLPGVFTPGSNRVIANTAAIMGITLGKQMPEVVGADVFDRTGNRSNKTVGNRNTQKST